MRIVIGEPKTRKSYQIEKEVLALSEMKIGDEFDGGILGLEGFKLKITGGSDKEGFPMRVEIPGPGRKRVLLGGPPGFHPLKEGQRRRKLVRGNAVSEAIMQLNCKIVSGEGDVAMILGIQPKAKEEKK
jgi:small subunit ribosomal protein S6e